jgi:hypothetical protein
MIVFGSKLGGGRTAALAMVFWLLRWCFCFVFGISADVFRRRLWFGAGLIVRIHAIHQT